MRTNPRCNLPARRGSSTRLLLVTVPDLTCRCKSECTRMKSRYRRRVPMQERSRAKLVDVNRLVSRLVSHAEGCSCSGSRGGLSATFVHPIGAPRLPSADQQLTLKPTVGAALWRGVDAFHRSCAAPISSSGIRHLTLQRRAHGTSLKHIWLDFRVYLVSFCAGRTGGVRCIFFGHVRINFCWSFWRSPWPSSAY